MREYSFMKDPFEHYGSTIIDFTDERVFENISLINGGVAERSSERAKLEDISLKWSYEKGSMLRICGVEALAAMNESPGAQGIKLWIYNPQRMDGELIVRIGKSKLVSVAPVYYFTVNMNFEGWRAIWIRLNVSAKTMLTQILADIDTIEIEAKVEKAGVMWLDAFEVMESVSYLQCADFQLPYLPLWSTGFHYESYKRTPLEADGVCTEEHKKAFELIMKKLDDYILPTELDYSSLDSKNPLKIRYDGLNELIKEEIKKYDACNIRRGEDGKMYGPGLFAASDNGKKHKFMDYVKFWVSLALDWKINKNRQSLERVMDMFDYFNDQGWAEGSSCGGMGLDEMRACGYVYALYILRDELKERGIFEREWATLRWRSEFGYIFSYRDKDIEPIVMMTCDKMRATMFYQLIYILGLEDSPLKVLYMKKYLECFEYFVSPKGGLDNGIKPDYTMWHHQGPYMTSYGPEAINFLCLIRYLLHDTCFSVSEECVKNLNKSLEIYKKTAYKNDIPALRLAGRFPGKKATMFGLLTTYASMAVCGDEDKAKMFVKILQENEPALDEFYKGILPSISWMETHGQPKLFEEARKRAEKTEKEAETNPDGHYVFPYSGYCILRRKNYMLSVSGWSSYIWDFENGYSENLYGRYINYGSALITSDGRCFDASKGLDWNNIPGTTAKYLSYDELISKSCFANRYHSDETFLGGVSLRGGNGIYAMRLHDTAFDSSQRATKSWFCFGDMIIALGSGICNDDKDHPTETTLFQSEIQNGDVIYLNSKPLDGFEYDGNNSECVWLTDTYSNGYIIPDGAGFFLRKNRQGLKLSNSKDYDGFSAVAYINHGTAPENAGYEYVIMPQCDSKTLEEAAKTPSYKVLKRDEGAHIVKVGNVTGYVIYNENEEFSSGSVKKTDTPCIIGETKLSEDEIVINISDPDLRMCDFPQGSEGKHILKLTLSGEWDAVSNDEIQIEKLSGETVISLGTRDGKETEIKLTLRK